MKKDKHLKKSIGEEVELKAYKPINGNKEFAGILKAFDDETITIEAGDENTPEEMVFQRSDIASIKLALDF